MNKYIYVFLVLLVLCNTSTLLLASDLSSEEIVPKFYNLLMKDAPPSSQDERDFFGDEDDGFKSLIIAKDKSNMGTPIWTYLREHRELFLPKGLRNKQKPMVIFSSPYKIFLLGTGAQKDGLRVSAFFPAQQTSDHGFSGESGVTFILGQKAYLCIGATLVQHPTQQMLYDVIHNELN